MKKHIIELAERSLSTFVFTFYGVIGVTPLSDRHALEAAAFAGAGSVLKYLATQAAIYLRTT